jgi:endonuclease/exonuclease/phosphatase (EEP) superfamily protein YafD
MRLILDLASLLVRGTTLMLGLVGALAGLGCLGGVFSDQLDALNHFAPFWLASGLASAVLAAAFARGAERKAFIALAAVAIVSTGLLIVPEVLSAARPTAKPAPSKTLKVIQFNGWALNDNPRASLDWVLAQNADIVVMEEGGGGAWPVIKGLRKAYPASTRCPYKHGCDTWIFSRWPIKASQQYMQEGVNLAGAWATIDHPSGAFTVAGTHFVWPYPAGPQKAQTQTLVKTLARFPRDTLILTGDFNSTPWSFALHRRDKALGMERRTRALASWPSGRFTRVASAPFPVLPIDHVYAGKAWKTVKVERGPALGSDHRPVVVTLTR